MRERAWGGDHEEEALAGQPSIEAALCGTVLGAAKLVMREWKGVLRTRSMLTRERVVCGATSLCTFSPYTGIFTVHTE